MQIPTPEEKRADYQATLKGLLNGTIKPSTVIGTGYVNPKQAASEWLRRQLLKIDGIEWDCLHVASNGLPYQSVDAAKRSKPYRVLEAGEYRLLTSIYEVDRYEIIALDGGYAVAVACRVKSKVA